MSPTYYVSDVMVSVSWAIHKGAENAQKLTHPFLHTLPSLFDAKNYFSHQNLKLEYFSLLIINYCTGSTWSTTTAFVG